MRSDDSHVISRRVRAATTLWAVLGVERGTHTDEASQDPDGTWSQDTHHSETVSVVFWVMDRAKAVRIVDELRKGRGPLNCGGWTPHTTWRVQEMMYPIPMNDDEATQLCESLATAWADRYVRLNKDRRTT